MRNVTIQGDGVAAHCCAHLLKRAGFRVVLQLTDRPRLPVIMLSESALALIRDVVDNQDLFRNLTRIRKRVVAWGKNTEPVALDHSAVVVSEQFLLESIRPELPSEGVHTASDWQIIASRPLPAGTVEHSFGSRTAFAAQVNLRSGSDSASCWIESFEGGWLFLIPSAPDSGWLLSVGSTPESLLGESRVITGQVAQVSDGTREFLACPRITSPLHGDKWLACGTAAVGFDPICGDGTAYAVREAILASAVIQAASEGGNSQDLLAHYGERVTAGFARHLALCRELYQGGHSGPWWVLQSESLQQGLEWCRRRLDRPSRVKYQLNGFRLTPFDEPGLDFRQAVSTPIDTP